MDWAQILVIILAVVVIVFLLLAVMLLMLLVRVTRQIKAVTGSAQRTAANLEQAVKSFNKASPLPLGKALLEQLMKKNNK